MALGGERTQVFAGPETQPRHRLGRLGPKGHPQAPDTGKWGPRGPCREQGVWARRTSLSLKETLEAIGSKTSLHKPVSPETKIRICSDGWFLPKRPGSSECTFTSFSSLLG